MRPLVLAPFVRAFVASVSKTILVPSPFTSGYRLLPFNSNPNRVSLTILRNVLVDIWKMKISSFPFESPVLNYSLLNGRR